MRNNMKNNLLKIMGALFVGTLVLVGMGLDVKADNSYKYIKDDGNEDTATSLQAAVDNAKSGTTIRMEADCDEDGTQNDGENTFVVLINNKTLTLDLNGHTLTGAATSTTDSFIKVKSGAKLTVTDSSAGKGGKITESQQSQLAYKHAIRNEGTFILDSGSIFEFHGDSNGTGVYNDNATFIMNGGSIDSCLAPGNSSNGGGVYNMNSNFTMNGGSIKNCSAENGGCIYNNDKSNFTMNNGSIENCSSINGGGGIYCEGGSTFTMNGGSISRCKLTGNVTLGAAAVMIMPNAKFYMNGGKITGCTSESTKSGTCGGVYLGEGSIFEIKGDSIIDGNNCQLANHKFYNLYSAPDTGHGEATVRITGNLTGKIRINSDAPTIELDGKHVYTGIENIIFVDEYGKENKGHLNISPNGKITVFPDGGVNSRTVTFDLDSHGQNVSIVLEKDSLVPLPANLVSPKAGGYIFLGWYKDSKCTEEWHFFGDANPDSIGDSNRIIYSKWTRTTGISINPSTLSMKKGETETLTCSYVPEAAEKPVIVWSSDNEKVATVESVGEISGKAAGKVKGIAAGEAVITVTTEDGEKTATCIVTVTEPESDEVIVTFDANGHGTAPNAIAAKKGKTIAEPVAPTEDGWIFEGWYKSKAAADEKTESDKWDFANDKVEADITLYAGWTEKENPVIIDYDLLKSEVPSGTVICVNPADPSIIMDMKVLSLDKMTCDNQAFLADYYAKSLGGTKADVILTKGIYPRRDLSISEKAEKRKLFWNNLPIKTSGYIYAICYDKEHGAYLLAGVVDKKGTAMFVNYCFSDACNITIFTVK